MLHTFLKTCCKILQHGIRLCSNRVQSFGLLKLFIGSLQGWYIVLFKQGANGLQLLTLATNKLGKKQINVCPFLTWYITTILIWILHGKCGSSLNIFELCLPKDALCQVWLKQRFCMKKKWIFTILLLSTLGK